MGLFDWLGSSKSLPEAVRSGSLRSARGAISRGVSTEELNRCILYATH